MAGGPTAAADDHGSVEDGGALVIALHGVAAVKLDQVVLSAHEIQACALYGFQENVTGSGVFDHSAAGDHVQLRENPVQQRDGQAAADILQFDLQGLRGALSCGIIHRGKPRQIIFPGTDGVAFVAQITAAGAVRASYGQAGGTVVPCAPNGKFLGEGVQGIGAVCACVVGISRETAVIKGQEIIRRSVYGRAIVEV